LPLCPVLKGAKTNQQRSGEKGSRSLAAVLLVPRSGTSLCCSQKANASESRTLYRVLRRVVFLLFAEFIPPWVLLGCVKWHFKKPFLCFWGPILSR